MTPDDPVGSTTRRVLYKLAFRDAVNLRPWSEIRALGRRIQRRRVAGGVAGIAIVLTGAGAANALVARNGPATAIRSERTVPTSSTSATTSTTSPATTEPVSTPRANDVPPPVSGTEPTAAETTTSTTDPALQPYERGVQFTASTTAERAQVAVGDNVVLYATMTNTGTRAFHTEGYGSFGVACAPWPEGSTPDFFDMGAFIPEVVLQPGQTETFTITLTATDYVGTVFCGVGFAYHGDAFAAGPNRQDPSADAFVEIVARSDTTTTAAPSTSTTVANPLATT